MESPVLGEELQGIAIPVEGRHLHARPLSLNVHESRSVDVHEPTAIVVPDDELVILTTLAECKRLLLNGEVTPSATHDFEFIRKPSIVASGSHLDAYREIGRAIVASGSHLDAYR